MQIEHEALIVVRLAPMRRAGACMDSFLPMAPGKATDRAEHSRWSAGFPPTGSLNFGTNRRLFQAIFSFSAAENVIV
jgi:hypothetical protein